MTRDEAVKELYRLLMGAADDYALTDGDPHPFLVKARERMAEGGDLRAALSSPCACGEPIMHGWLNYIECEDGSGLHLRLFLHDDPDDRPDDTEYVAILPAEEESHD